jgi:ribosome maturation factor RimP
MTEKTKKSKLSELVEDTLSATEFEVVSVDFTRAGDGPVLRVSIDHPEGVTLDHCQSATRLILNRLEEEDPIKDDYHIEVSSPGVDRPLVKRQDYQRFINKRVFVKTHGPVDGTKTFTGALIACRDEEIEINCESNGKIYKIAFEQIAKATLKPILHFT